MNKNIVIGFALFAVVAAPVVPPVHGADEATGRKTLAATMDVYVFPKDGQAAEQQSKDEATCYSWAVGNTGTDPFELAKRADSERDRAEQEKEAAQMAGAGAGAAGAVRGAAMGALIGEIANDDAGGGAAWGAAAGIMSGRRRSRAAKKQATDSAERRAQSAEQKTGQGIEGFKKAFSVCLEAKNYLVKF